MAIVKTFNHQLHVVNYLRSFVKKSLAEYTPKTITMPPVPILNKSLQYYFVFETQARNDIDQMLYAICCFSEDGEIIFSVRSSMPVSLWRYRRQGMAATAAMIEGVVKSQFKRNNVPLHKDTPFSPASEGIYLANLDWFIYKRQFAC